MIWNSFTVSSMKKAMRSLEDWYFFTFKQYKKLLYFTSWYEDNQTKWFFHGLSVRKSLSPPLSLLLFVYLPVFLCFFVSLFLAFSFFLSFLLSFFLFFFFSFFLLFFETLTIFFVLSCPVFLFAGLSYFRLFVPTLNMPDPNRPNMVRVWAL